MSVICNNEVPLDDLNFEDIYPFHGDDAVKSEESEGDSTQSSELERVNEVSQAHFKTEGTVGRTEAILIPRPPPSARPPTRQRDIIQQLRDEKELYVRGGQGPVHSLPY